MRWEFWLVGVGMGIYELISIAAYKFYKKKSSVSTNVRLPAIFLPIATGTAGAGGSTGEGGGGGQPDPLNREMPSFCQSFCESPTTLSSSYHVANFAILLLSRTSLARILHVERRAVC